MVIPQLPQLSPVTLTIQRTVPLGTVTTTVQLVFSGSSRIPVLAALEKSGGVFVLGGITLPEVRAAHEALMATDLRSQRWSR